MADRGRFRRAFPWLPAPTAAHDESRRSDPPKGDALKNKAPGDPPRSATPTRRFGSTEHLSAEAIAAYVDGELRMSAHLRAAHHLTLCPQCEAEVEDQIRARAALRDSRPIRIPSTLLGMLSDIPRHDDEKRDGPKRQ